MLDRGPKTGPNLENYSLHHPVECHPNQVTNARVLNPKTQRFWGLVVLGGSVDFVSRQ